MAYPLMPKGTAVWLLDNTTLSFEQIADFCGMHALEIQGIADGEVAAGIKGQDPLLMGELEKEEIEKAEKNESYRMQLSERAKKHAVLEKAKKGARYTPIARRQDKPEAIQWIIKYHPYIPDSQIVRLIGTTKKTIESIRGRSHWNINNIKAKDPVLLGLCLQTKLDTIVNKFRPADAKPIVVETSEDDAA